MSLSPSAMQAFPKSWLCCKKQMQSNDNRLRQRNETEEFVNRLDSACIGAMSATDYEGVQEAVQVIQDEIRKVRQRGK